MTLFIGLTGSIGMGKSVSARQLRQLGLPVHDADAVVHAALRPDGAAFVPVSLAFPDVVVDGRIDRRLLGQRVFHDLQALKTLEKIIHPIVQAAEQRFRRRLSLQRRKWAVLDIPLLYETGADRRIPVIAVVTAPAFIQRQRVLKRPGMDAARFAAVLARQWPDRVKRTKADAIIHTGLGQAFARQQWCRLLRDLRTRPPRRQSMKKMPLFGTSFGTSRIKNHA